MGIALLPRLRAIDQQLAALDSQADGPHELNPHLRRIARRLNALDDGPLLWNCSLEHFLDRAEERVVSLGGGGGSYHADAVVFDGTQWLNIDALTTPADNGSISWAGWFWIPPDSPPDHFFYRVVWVADPLTPDTGYQNWMTMELSLEHPLANTQQWDLGVDNYSKVFIGTDGDTGVFTLNSWHHVMFSAETNFGVGSKRAALYIDDELNILVTGDEAAAFIMAYSGLPFWVFNDGVNDQYKGYASDVWIAPNVSLLNGGNSIPEATRRLFISADGKPVDPSGFPSSAILFSGNASTFGDNQGTGGAFTWTGAPTNSDMSPSD
jgi:hypothetical protein